MTTKVELKAIKTQIIDGQRRGPQALQEIITDNSANIARYLASEKTELARVLSVASGTALAGTLSKAEADVLARALISEPALLSRLLTGTGA